MDVVAEVLGWFTDPVNWSGNDGVPQRLLQHTGYSLVATVVAAAVALPVGVWLGHTNRGGQLAINLSNIGRAIPAFGIVLAAVIYFGISPTPVILALVALAIPPILTNAYVGIRAVDPEVRDAATGMGLRAGQVLTQVELPIALPLVMAGLRTAAVQVVATATIAAYAGLGGLGRYIIDGLGQRRLEEVVAGALLVAVYSLLVEYGLDRIQRLVVSEGVAARTDDADQPEPAAAAA